MKEFTLTEAQRTAADRRMTVEASGAEWLAVRSYLTLALRHPGTRAMYTHPIATDFVRHLSRALVLAGVVTRPQLEALERLEAENTP